VIVGSAPCFPNGLIDPIEDLAALAQSHDIGFHTDACLGGFVLPWAERLGAPVPPFDFRVPGVTSMSADTHKYGYAAKGTSVVLYRDAELRHFQFYRTAKWAGGLYFSPTFAGSRPGALSAACWAAMLSLGEAGYLDATGRILEAAAAVKAGIATIDGVEVIGDPLWNVAFTTDVDVYRVLDVLGHHGWSLNGLQDPPSIHLCVTLRHTQPGVIDRFLEDLAAAVATVRADPDAGGSMAPIYGMATMADMQGTVEQLLEGYVDLLFEP
jgi:glutamate/tyrosine decarboxylase-like PLP-dependent enzyme